MSNTATRNRNRLRTEAIRSIFKIQLWISTGQYRYEVVISDALGKGHTEGFTELGEAREFANRAYREAGFPGAHERNPQELAEDVAYFLYAADERCCECEIDWKCPLCQETGRYHSRLDR